MFNVTQIKSPTAIPSEIVGEFSGHLLVKDTVNCTTFDI